jgi:hypothetical protein
MRNLVVFGALLITSAVGCSPQDPVYTDVLDMHGASVEQMQIVISEAFDLSEVAILKKDPDDVPKPLGPDPDPKKCVCKGTGVITHGDGHKSPCPYHGKGDKVQTPNLVVEGDVLYKRSED